MKKESNFEIFLSDDDQCSKNSKTSCVDDNILSSDKVINGNRKTIEKIRSNSTMMSTEIYFSFFSFRNRPKPVGQHLMTKFLYYPMVTHIQYFCWLFYGFFRQLNSSGNFLTSTEPFCGLGIFLYKKLVWVRISCCNCLWSTVVLSVFYLYLIAVHSVNACWTRETHQWVIIYL